MNDTKTEADSPEASPAAEPAEAKPQEAPEAAPEGEPLLAGDEASGDEEVPDPLDQVAELESQLKEARDRLLRTVAELDNLHKRSRRDAEEASIRGQTEVLRQVLPAIDSIDLALKSAESGNGADAMLEGMRMVKRQFLTSMERFGVKPIESMGIGFDPNFHEAVAQIASDKYAAGQVAEEMRKGYLIGDRLLRAALVIVSKGPPAPVAAKQEENVEKPSDGVPTVVPEGPAVTEGAAEAQEGGASADAHSEEEDV